MNNAPEEEIVQIFENSLNNLNNANILNFGPKLSYEIFDFNPNPEAVPVEGEENQQNKMKKSELDELLGPPDESKSISSDDNSSNIASDISLEDMDEKGYHEFMGKQRDVPVKLVKYVGKKELTPKERCKKFDCGKIKCCPYCGINFED